MSVLCLVPALALVRYYGRQHNSTTVREDEWHASDLLASG